MTFLLATALVVTTVLTGLMLARRNREVSRPQHGRVRRAPLLLALVVTACGLLDGGAAIQPGRLPEGPPTGIGETAIGPITVLGQDVFEGAEWRFSIYESVAGWCTQFEFPGGGGAGCGGDLTIEEGRHIVSNGGGSGGDSPSNWHGLASQDVATASFVTEGGERLPVHVFDLSQHGFDSQLWFALGPPEADGRIFAYDEAGGLLEQIDLPG